MATLFDRDLDLTAPDFTALLPVLGRPPDVSEPQPKRSKSDDATEEVTDLTYATTAFAFQVLDDDDESKRAGTVEDCVRVLINPFQEVQEGPRRSKRAGAGINRNLDMHVCESPAQVEPRSEERCMRKKLPRRVRPTMQMRLSAPRATCASL